MIVLALPPGGVPVAYEIALALHAPLDVLCVQRACLRGSSPSLPLKSKIVVLVDDGSATGAMMRTAIAAVRQQQPIRVLVAVPIADHETCETLRRDADEVHCGIIPVSFSGIDQWYECVTPVSEEEAFGLLHKSVLFTRSRPSTQARPKAGRNGERLEGAKWKFLIGVFLMVCLQAVLAGCPPRKPTPIVHDSGAWGAANQGTVHQ